MAEIELKTTSAKTLSIGLNPADSFLYNSNTYIRGLTTADTSYNDTNNIQVTSRKPLDWDMMDVRMDQSDNLYMQYYAIPKYNFLNKAISHWGFTSNWTADNGLYHHKTLDNITLNYGGWYAENKDKFNFWSKPTVIYSDGFIDYYGDYFISYGVNGDSITINYFSDFEGEQQKVYTLKEGDELIKYERDPRGWHFQYDSDNSNVKLYSHDPYDYFGMFGVVFGGYKGRINSYLSDQISFNGNIPITIYRWNKNTNSWDIVNSNDSLYSLYNSILTEKTYNKTYLLSESPSRSYLDSSGGTWNGIGNIDYSQSGQYDPSLPTTWRFKFDVKYKTFIGDSTPRGDHGFSDSYTMGIRKVTEGFLQFNFIPNFDGGSKLWGILPSSVPFVTSDNFPMCQFLPDPAADRQYFTTPNSIPGYNGDFTNYSISDRILTISNGGNSKRFDLSGMNCHFGNVAKWTGLVLWHWD